MARTWTLFALLICGLAVGSSSATTTPTPTPTRTSTAPQPPSTSQRPAPSVPPTPPKSSTYTLHDNHGKVCLMMVANMSVIYTYKNASNASSQNVTIEDPILNASTNGSNCTAEEAKLILMWQPPSSEGYEVDPRCLTLNFSANHNKGSRHWTFDGVDLKVVFSKAFFIDYDGNNPTGDLLYNASGFFDDKVEFQRGYRCDATQEYPLKYHTKYQISAKLTVRDFHVQAFQFKDAGKFGNARRCQKDSGDGNKVVPIAVGVALAVLVIAVIIAFFISKIVNRRRQTSYESLN